MADQGWGGWLTERMSLLGFGSNSELGRASGVPDSAISRWRTIGTVPSIGQLRRLVEPLQATLLELLVAAGHVTVDEAGLRDAVPPPRQVRSTRDAIRVDPDLPEELKHLLEAQYDAMRVLARSRGRTGLQLAVGD